MTTKRRRLKLDIDRGDIYRFLAVLVVFSAGAWFGGYVHSNQNAAEIVRALGYPGAFAVSVVSGFNLAVPVPAAAFMPAFLAAGLSFWPTILVMTAGMTVADSFAYVIGAAGRKLIKKEGRIQAIISRLRSARRRSRVLPFVLLGIWIVLVPLPNELIVLPLAFLGYRFLHILPFVLVGNFIFNTVFAKGVLGFLGG